MSSLLSFHTGQPFNITSNVDSTGTGEGVAARRPDRESSCRRVDSFNSGGVTWINPAAFAAPAPGTYGTLPRNFYTGRDSATWTFPWSRTRRLRKGSTRQFRIELFNIFNRKNLAPPSGGCGVSNFNSTR